MTSSTIAHLLEVQQASGRSLSVVVARLGGLIEVGVAAVLSVEPSLRLLDCGMELAPLEATVAVQQPDVVVLGDPQVSDARVFRRLRAVWPGLGVVVLLSGVGYRGAQMLDCGANACVAERASAEELLQAVRVAGAGGRFLVAGGERDGDRERLPLSEREVEVLRLIGEGKTNAQAAQELCVSLETVRTHAQHLYRKLGVTGRRQLRALDPRRLA